jgi:hypothetical protein
MKKCSEVKLLMKMRGNLKGPEGIKRLTGKKRKKRRKELSQINLLLLLLLT